ncbi:putative amidoligase domain-containing protein [Paenibacillus humicola]|uniref:putative amidoligase domain-containing protein n=1 Tax=Paenibacillus humicola TaxID=3110540 RepID=UPI00237B3EE6|nr:hypothetical protein [Paenibacillus humicola]
MGSVWLWGDGLPDLRPEFAAEWEDGAPAEDDAVAVWGTRPLPAASPGGAPAGFGAGQPLILNAGAASFAALPGAELRRRLARAGVAVSASFAHGGRGAFAGGKPCRRPSRSGGQRREGPLPAPEAAGCWSSERVYAVSLFHLRPIEVVWRQSSGLGGDAAGEVDPAVPLCRSLTKLAAKALYAAGLENGTAELARERGGRLKLLGLRVPDGRELTDGPWLTALRAFGRELTAGREQGGGPSREIRIGADPEFLLLTEAGKVVPAARFLDGLGGVGSDSALIGGRVMHPLAELRPAPARTPEGLAANVRVLLLQAASRIPDPRLRWAAGGMPVSGFALGGHLHLSGVAMTSRLLRQLDSFLAMPLALVESPEERRRRPRYGSLGDFRLQPHGGFEYRTLPSWLVSPAAAKAAFALALLCARETEALDYVPALEERYIAAYYDGDRETLRECLEPLAACMARTASYSGLARHIEPLLEAARRGRTWDAASDLRIKWRIPPYG